MNVEHLGRQNDKKKIFGPLSSYLQLKILLGECILSSPIGWDFSGSVTGKSSSLRCELKAFRKARFMCIIMSVCLVVSR